MPTQHLRRLDVDVDAAGLPESFSHPTKMIGQFLSLGAAMTAQCDNHHAEPRQLAETVEMALGICNRIRGPVGSVATHSVGHDRSGAEAVIGSTDGKSLGLQIRKHPTAEIQTKMNTRGICRLESREASRRVMGEGDTTQPEASSTIGSPFRVRVLGCDRLVFIRHRDQRIWECRHEKPDRVHRIR